MGPGIAGEQGRARQQKRDHRIPAVLGELLNRRDMLKAGVRDHRVQPTDCSTAVVTASPFPSRVVRSARKPTSPRTSTLSTSHPSPARRLAGQTSRDRGTDTAGGAGDERDAPRAAHMSIPPLTPQIAPVMNED
jgi:hypothetical protein